MRCQQPPYHRVHHGHLTHLVADAHRGPQRVLHALEGHEVVGRAVLRAPRRRVNGFLGIEACENVSQSLKAFYHVLVSRAEPKRGQPGFNLHQRHYPTLTVSG